MFMSILLLLLQEKDTVYSSTVFIQFKDKFLFVFQSNPKDLDPSFFQSNSKDIDPSYKMDLDLWDCIGRENPVL